MRRERLNRGSKNWGFADEASVRLSLRALFGRAQKTERQYVLRLRLIARSIDHIVRSFDFGQSVAETSEKLHSSLMEYSRVIDPWARAVAQRMVAEVAARDERSWVRVSAAVGEGLRREIESAPVGRVMRQRLEDQVKLIRSIPEEAAKRVREVATAGVSRGLRAEDIVTDILRTGSVSRSKADTIARTETTRTSTELTRARAEHVGSTHFRWVTAGDSDVRASHRKLNGTTHRWDEPPVCDAPDVRALPGCVWNCRCYAEPILDKI